MKNHNPAIIPRNQHAEEVLSVAEKGDLSMMTELLSALSNPYDYTQEQEKYSKLQTSLYGCYKTFCGT